jgi:hypothetical protein
MRTVTIAAVVLFLGGCHVSTTADHILASNAPESVPAGGCVPVEGPFPIPGGATFDYSVSDVGDFDVMTVGIIDDAFGCAFSQGYGVTSGTGSVSNSTEDVVDGEYDFVVQCNNLSADCVFSLDWSANY